MPPVRARVRVNEIHRQIDGYLEIEKEGEREREREGGEREREREWRV